MNRDSYRWFTNRNCEYYPCHKFEEINCLFCFCPLYLFDDCGGDFSVLKNGMKDCSNCTIPHNRNGYDHIIERLTRKAKESGQKGQKVQRINSNRDKSAAN